MTDAEQFTSLGRLYAELEQERLQHRRTLEVLRQVVAGELEVSRLEVESGGWRILPAAAPILRGLTTDDIKDAARTASGSEG